MTKVMRTALPVVAGLFLVFYLVTSPDVAANIFHAGWRATVNIAHGVGHFIDKVAS